MNNLYFYTHPSDSRLKPSTYRESSLPPVTLPTIRLKQRTIFSLLLIGLVVGIPGVIKFAQSDSCCGCPTGANGNIAPTGYGTASPSSGDTTTVITFTATLTGCTVGGIMYTWTFGDGGSASGKPLAIVTHTYKNGGIFTWTLSLQNDPSYFGPPTPPGTNAPLSGTINIAGHWTNFDASIEPSQTIQCLTVNDPSRNGGNPYKDCMAWRVEVKADGQETNVGVDYFQLTLRFYNYNTSGSNNFGIYDYDAIISFASPSPGGVNTYQPQPGTRLGQDTVILSYSFLSVSLLLPETIIDCRVCNLNTLDWHVYSPAWCCNTFASYAEHGADISLPEGQAWTINFSWNYNLNLSYELNGVSCTYVTPQCSFNWSGSIGIPAGHQDPPPGPACCSSTSVAGGGGSAPRAM